MNLAVELADERLDTLVRYVSLLGVRARRDLTDTTTLQGEELFGEIGCADCHRPTFTTSPYHPLAEYGLKPFTPIQTWVFTIWGKDCLTTDDQRICCQWFNQWRTPRPQWSIGLGILLRDRWCR